MLRRLTILMMVLLTFFLAQPLPALQGPVSAAEADARLRARVETYWSSMQQGAYTKAAELVKSSDRDFFLTVKKEPILSYVIDRIRLEENQTRGHVDVTLKRRMMRSYQAVEVKSENTWELIDGEWFVALDKTRPTFFGGVKAGGQVLNPSSLQINPKPDEADKVPANDIDRAVINIDAGESPLLAVYDFGSTFSGDSVNYKFRFKNVGKAPLKIKALQTTDPALSLILVGPNNKESSKRQFDPNEAGEALVALNSRDLDGPIEYHAAVLFEGRKLPLTLAVKGFVSKNFTLTPARADLGGPGNVRAEVMVFNETGSFINFKGAPQAPAFLDAAMSKGGLAPRDQALLRVSIKPNAKIPPAGYEGVVVVLTDLDRQPALRVPIRIRGSNP